MNRAVISEGCVEMILLTNDESNPLEWGWKGKTGFFWAGTAALMTVWAYFRLPEAKVRCASVTLTSHTVIYIAFSSVAPY